MEHNTSKHNRTLPTIRLSDPFPLLDPGDYVARCAEATYDWARQWNKWIAILALEPLNYYGRPYSGQLCKFLGLGKNREAPYAGPQSHFRQLLVEVNGAQPSRPDVGMEIFVGVLYDIEVVTVTKDRNDKERPPEHWYSVVRGIHPCKDQSERTFQPSNFVPFNSSTQRTQTTHSIDQHSNPENTPLAKQQERAREVQTGARSLGLGSEQFDQKHNYPDERAAGKSVQPSRAKPKNRETRRGLSIRSVARTTLSAITYKLMCLNCDLILTKC